MMMMMIMITKWGTNASLKLDGRCHELVCKYSLSISQLGCEMLQTWGAGNTFPEHLISPSQVGFVSFLLWFTCLVLSVELPILFCSLTCHYHIAFIFSHCIILIDVNSVDSFILWLTLNLYSPHIMFLFWNNAIVLNAVSGKGTFEEVQCNMGAPQQTFIPVNFLHGAIHTEQFACHPYTAQVCHHSTIIFSVITQYHIIVLCSFNFFLSCPIKFKTDERSVRENRDLILLFLWSL